MNKDLCYFKVPECVREKELFAEQKKRAPPYEVLYEPMLNENIALKDNTYQCLDSNKLVLSSVENSLEQKSSPISIRLKFES